MLLNQYLGVPIFLPRSIKFFSKAYVNWKPFGVTFRRKKAKNPQRNIIFKWWKDESTKSNAQLNFFVEKEVADIFPRISNSVGSTFIPLLPGETSFFIPPQTWQSGKISRRKKYSKEKWMILENGERLIFFFFFCLKNGRS